MIQMQDLWQGQSVQTARKYVLMTPSLEGGGWGWVKGPSFQADRLCLYKVGVSAAVLPILQYAHMLCVHNA